MKKEFYALQLIALFCSWGCFAYAMMPGGISDSEKPVKPELASSLASLNDKLMESVAAQSGFASNGEEQTATPVTFKSQVVAGTNYFVKYHIMPADQYFHARIFRSLQGKFELVRVVGPKKKDDPIGYF